MTNCTRLWEWCPSTFGLEKQKTTFMKTIQLIALLLFASGLSFAQTTWYEIPTGTNKKLNAIDFPTPSVGYIGGNDSLLLKSIDGGETWTEINYTGVTFNIGADSILDIQFVTESIGYMTAGNFGGIYKTIDGGLSWTGVTPFGNLCFVDGLFFFDENNGFVGGSGCFIGETIEKMNGGVMGSTTINTPTWDATNLVVDIDFLNSNFGLAASYSGYILRTLDGGSTWDTIPSGLGTGIPLTSVSIVDDTLAYAGYNDLGGGFGVLRSVDAGLTWSMDISSATFYYPAFFSVHTAGNGFVYSGAQPSWGTTGLIFENTGPDLWAYYDVDQPIYDMTSYSDSVIFGVGDSGYVVVNIPPGNLGLGESGADEMDIAVFPNPANEQISIGLKSDVAEFSFSIVNMSGEIVLQGQTENRNVNVANLPAGIFVIQITDGALVGNSRFVKL